MQKGCRLIFGQTFIFCGIVIILGRVNIKTSVIVFVDFAVCFQEIMYSKKPLFSKVHLCRSFVERKIIKETFWVSLN